MTEFEVNLIAIDESIAERARRIAAAEKKEEHYPEQIVRTFNKWMCAPLKHISFTILYGESPWRYWSSLKKKCQQDPSQKEWYVFADFVLRHLALPASSASCERLFYRQNMNVPPNRARMKEKTAIARIIIGRK